MAEKKPQTYANHVKLDPAFHYVLSTTLLLAIVLSVTNVVRHYDTLSAWTLLVLTIAAVNTAFRARIYALKAQDRVIRLEERLRLTTLLPERSRSRIGELTESQLVAIRFASDAEAPALIEKTLAENLKNSEIKKAITNWRPDYFRI